MSDGTLAEPYLQATRASLADNRPPVDSLLVNKATLAALLTCSVRKVDKLIEQKRIPVIRLGKRCHRFDVADVLAALKGVNILPKRRSPGQIISMEPVGHPGRVGNKRGRIGPW